MTYDQYAAEIQRLQDALARVAKEAVPQWISVKDRLPECNKDVLIYAVSKSGNSDAVICITERKDYIWFGHEIPMQPYWKDPWQYFHSSYDITHWMPLPEPPESEDDTDA